MTGDKGRHWEGKNDYNVGEDELKSQKIQDGSTEDQSSP